MKGSRVRDYEELKDKIDLYKSHYENLFYILLSVLAGFITLGLYLLGDLSDLLGGTTLQILRRFFTSVPTLSIVFLSFILGCWLFQIGLRTVGSLFDVIYRPFVLKSKGEKVVSTDIIKSVFSLLALLLSSLIVFMVVKTSILENLFRLYIFLGVPYMFVDNLNWNHEKELLSKEILAVLIIFGSYGIIFQEYMLHVLMLFINAVLITRILDLYYKMININQAVEIIYKNEKSSEEYTGGLEEVNRELQDKIDEVRRKSLIPLIRIDDVLKRRTSD